MRCYADGGWNLRGVQLFQDSSLDVPIAITFVCVNNIVTDLYQPAIGYGHASVLVDEKLYLWAGYRQGYPPYVHSSAEKLRATSYVDVFHCRMGMWVR